MESSQEGGSKGWEPYVLVWELFVGEWEPCAAEREQCGGIPGIARGPPICESTLLPPIDRSSVGTGSGEASRWRKKSDKS